MYHDLQGESLLVEWILVQEEYTNASFIYIAVTLVLVSAT